MSNYKDFVKDFPTRCISVIDRFYTEAKHADREVTLLLMATAGSLVMAYERLSLGNSIQQLDLDRGLRKTQMNLFTKELEKKIGQSTVLGKSIKNWRYAKLDEGHDEASIIKAAETAEQISPEKWVSTAIKIMRHSIAHGNVMALESVYIGQIKDLVFVSRDWGKDNKVINAKLVVLTPADLESFLRQWCNFLRSLPSIKQQEALYILDNVAI